MKKMLLALLVKTKNLITALVAKTPFSTGIAVGYFGHDGIKILLEFIRRFLKTIL